MKNRVQTVKIILDILISIVLAFIVRNYSFDFRNGYYWGGELAFPILTVFWNLGGKKVLKDILKDLKGER